MPTEGERVHRLTLNLSADLYAEIAELARVTHLNVAPCARMLIAEALEVRTLYKNMTPSSEADARAEQAATYVNVGRVGQVRSARPRIDTRA